MAYIYKITNLINNKSYIGKTLYSIDKRWQEHCRDSRKLSLENRPLYRSMRKHGIENFSIECIEEVDDTKINNREAHWIEFFDTYRNGYNATIGGDGKQRINHDTVIQSYQELQNANEVARTLHISPDSVRKILKAHNITLKSGYDVVYDARRCPVDMYSLTNDYIKTFESIVDCAKYFDDVRKRAHIWEACEGKRQSAYHFKWKYHT